MISFQLTFTVSKNCYGRELLDRVHNSLKSLRVVHGKVGKHFAVETDVLLGETAHKLGVGDSVLAGGGVDTLDPQGAEFSLLGATVAVSVGETFLIGVLRNRPNIFPGQEVTAGSLENLLAACPGGNRIN